MTLEHLYDDADRNDDGELILEREGRFTSYDVNLTSLLQPGIRKTSNPTILKVEAEHAADPDESVGNPAFPVNEDLAEKIAEWCEKNDLEPAWLNGPATDHP